MKNFRLWGPVYLVSVTALLFTVFRHWAYDDPFITYRYAENIAAGLGFVYNPGESVLSTTTPLFTLMLAIAAWLGLDVNLTANFIGAASMAAGGLMFWLIAGRLTSHTVSRGLIGITGLLLYPTFPLLISTIGSETPLMLAFCLAAITAYLNRRYAAAGVWLGFALLTRGDSVVLAAALVLDWLLIRREESPSIPWRAAIAAAVVLLPWAIYGSLTFGSPLPVTLEAKGSQSLLEGSVAFMPGLIRLLAGYSQLPAYWALGLLSITGIFYSLRDRTSGLLFLSWSLMYIAAFSLMGLTSYFWYYAPIVLGLIATAGIGAAELGRRLRIEKRAWQVAPILFVILFVFFSQISSLNRLRDLRDNRYEIYQAIGEWFSENTPETTQIATLEVGIIGYYARPRPMVDFTGLIRPEVVDQFYQGYTLNQAATWTAERYQPDYIVLPQNQYRELMQKYVSVRCVKAVTFEGAGYGYPGAIDIFIC